MKKHQNTQFRGKAPLLITALTIACFGGLYLRDRQTGSPASTAPPSTSGVQTKSKRTADQFAADQKTPGSSANPIALWPAPVSLAPEAPAPAPVKPQLA